ncbi:MAG: signal recognition particle-docking protein FtsY, partial [Deltaproteobacteria bacterium]|nr:signal recognition particle-docking protein FtsY [Deltaproteobacteria bacterium]
INGAGKTTSVARLGHYLKSQGRNVVFAAGDTFRAGAIDQLQLWADKLGIVCVKADYKSDPASVIFEGWQKAKAQNAVLIADTAGRLHTQSPLMEQLSKIVRVLQKDPALVLQNLLVLDGTNGQNALIQSKEFSKDIPIDGLIMTKLDGSSKGGAVISSSLELQVPIQFVGVGEKESDFVPFEVDSFLHSFYGI